jgi:hypothetical protein
MIVIISVKKLNYPKVNEIICIGLVSALELADAKKA